MYNCGDYTTRALKYLSISTARKKISNYPIKRKVSEH